MFSTLQPNLFLSPKSGGGGGGGGGTPPVQFNTISSTSMSVGQVAQSSSAQLQPVMPSDIDEKSLKDCTEVLQRQIIKLKNLNEFSNVLQIDNINTPTVSGHTDFYYPNLSYQLHNYQQDLCELSKIKHIPMPSELVEQFSQMQATCFMGLFTSITRAWLTIDNLIFFWNYEDGTDICFYDNLSEPILAVELFVPKPGTFDESIEYGLCLVTNSQVILLSIDFIRFTKGNGAVVNEMRFSPQPLYSISTDNIIMNTVRAAKSTGRIFMGGNDGSLYEFYYQNQSSWFSTQTKKINLSHSKFHYLVPSFLNFNEADSIIQMELDETRNVLYTRSENSTIQVFYLGSNGSEASKIGSLSCASIASKAAGLINSNDKHLFMPIIHISPIKLTESSKNIALCACTQYGIRLYFSITYFEQYNQQSAQQQQQQQQQAQASTSQLDSTLQPVDAQQQTMATTNTTTTSQQLTPSTFQLVHVRLPPNIDFSGGSSASAGGASSSPPGPITGFYASDGVSLMTMRRDEQLDSLLLLNRDLFLLHSTFKESKAIFDIDGRVWAIEEIVPSLASIRAAAQENDLLQTAKSASGLALLPKLTAEYFDLPRRFAMITPQGCFIWNKLRPVDQLTIVLRESSGPNSEGVRLFFNKIYERSEACSLCLAVALLHSNDSRIYEWATQAYFIYSGEAEIRKKSALVGGGTLTAATAPAVGANPYYGANNLNMSHMLMNPQDDYHAHHQMNAENTLYGDMSMYNARLYQQQQQQQAQVGPKCFPSILNSPQQMSTPIVMRTKSEQSPYSAQSTGGAFKPPLAQFSQRPFQQVQPQQPQQQQQQSQQMSQQQQQQQQQLQKSECEIHFSGKHDALYIYLARLMAPIWDQKILVDLKPKSSTSDAESLFVTFAEINLQWYLNKLNELRRFIDANFPHLKTLHHSYLTSSLFNQIASGNAANQSPSAAAASSRFATQFGSMPLNMPALLGLTAASTTVSEDRLAIEIENGSIFLLRQYLSRTIEVFGLLKILDEHKFHFISPRLDKSTQQCLLNMQVRTFLLADNSLLEQLITALLYRYIDDNACTDLLNQSLKQACPSLYTNENALFSKGCEKLKQALTLKQLGGDPYEQERLLKEGIDLMKQLGYVANLPQVCDMLAAAGCYEAVFELCLSAADRRDPQSIALFYYKKGEPVEDIQGAHYFALRSECYKCMLDCLTNLVKTPPINMANAVMSPQQQQTGSGVGGGIFPSLVGVGGSGSRQAMREKLEEQIAQLIGLVIQSRDELAHVALFNWMIQIGMERKLVNLQSPFIESYLIREMRDAAPHSKMSRLFFDLLWRHYDYKKDYVNAAKVLAALAEKYGDTQLSLKERVEYLTQAIVALNSANPNQHVKDELAELNDKKDVALLQEKIYIELSKIEPKSEQIQEALIQLDSQLFDITKLFYEFAQKFDLLNCQLAIYKMARHDAPREIEMLWKEIIANELDKLNRPDVKPSDLKNELTENIVRIAKEYVDDDEKYFPLTTLIDSLEFVSLSRGFEPEWGPNLLRKLHIPFDRLLHAYNTVYLQKDIKWTENLSRFINSIFCLVDMFMRAPNVTNETDKYLFVRSVKDLIPKYLTELNAINDDLSQELISRFKTVSYMLDRM